MAEQQDYIVYQPPAPSVGGARRTSEAGSARSLPLTEGLWQNETLNVLTMYSEKDKFSPLPTQGTLFPMPEVTAPPAPTPAAATSAAREPDQLIPHWPNFKFLAEDSKRFAKKLRDLYSPAEVKAPERLREIPSPGPDGQIFDPKTMAIKADHFPGRIIYGDGGLYPKNDLAAQERAPNYRKVKDKPVHGVGQPTSEGFRDVLDHLKGKDKPIVWANMRAEAILYVEGKPYNLRQLGSMENLDLKQGASPQELEAAEEKLKQQLLAKGKLTITEEVPLLGQDGKPVLENGRPRFTSKTREVQLTSQNTQTTQDVVQGLKAEGYQLEYRRIPLTDEKSPGANGVESLRDFMNEMSAKYPGKDTQFVFNCHQGKGRTTTAMVTAGITLDGRGERQLELPFEETRERAERNIKDNAQLQNLNTTVDEYKKKAGDADRRAQDLEAKAQAESDSKARQELEQQAARARADEAKYEENAREFTKRYALMQKYSEYVTEFGSHAQKPSFEDWMKQSAQVTDLASKWASLNQMCGLTLPSSAVA
jgi:hypothetical protein